MTYTCKCTDGPAEGKEFLDHRPPITIDIPYQGQVLEYHLFSVLNHGCVYRFSGLSEEGDPSAFFPLLESPTE